MTIVHDTAQSGPMAQFRARIEVTEQFAKVFFKQRAWNDIVRAGLFAGGERFRIDYLPLRFTMYAHGVLGYRGHGFPPLVESGRLRADALANSWVEARVTSTMASLTIHISTPTMLDHQGNSTGLGYSANPMVYQVLSTITAREIGYIAETAEATMLSLIEGANPSVTRKGTVRGTLTKTQRESIAHTKRKPLVATSRAA